MVGTNGFTTTVHEMDVRPGGVWRLTMHDPDGLDYPNRIVFIEIVRPEQLINKHEPAKGDEPVSFQVRVNFSARDDKTELTARLVFPSAAAREHVVTKYSAIEGMNQHLSRLELHLTELGRNGGSR